MNQTNRSRWREHLETAANLMTIGTLVLLCGLLLVQWNQRVNATQSTAGTLPEIWAAGTILSDDNDLSFSGSDLTILVGLSTTCRYCEESMPALRRLDELVESSPGSAGHLQVVALAGQPTEVFREYLQARGLRNLRPLSLAEGAIPERSQLERLIAMTPSVVVVDRAGAVLAGWPGLITPERLDEILRVAAAYAAPLAVSQPAAADRR